MIRRYWRAVQPSHWWIAIRAVFITVVLGALDRVNICHIAPGRLKIASQNRSRNLPKALNGDRAVTRAAAGG
jgi:hypothetical protein